MRKILAILALVLVSGAAVANPPEDVTQALTKLENDWAKMALSGDAAALEKLLTPDYVYTNQNGEMATRADMISSMKSGGTKYDTFTVEDVLLSGRTPGDEALAAFLTFAPAGSPACFSPDLTIAARTFVCGARDIMSSPAADFRMLRCDAISIVLAFRGEPAAIGDFIDASVVLKDCSDSGAVASCGDGGT